MSAGGDVTYRTAVVDQVYDRLSNSRRLLQSPCSTVQSPNEGINVQGIEQVRSAEVFERFVDQSDVFERFLWGVCYNNF